MTTATEVGYVEMRIDKVVGFATAEDEPFYYVVLDEVAGDRHLASRSVTRRPSAWRRAWVGSPGAGR
jgi:hypothetical protein